MSNSLVYLDSNYVPVTRSALFKQLDERDQNDQHRLAARHRSRLLPQSDIFHRTKWNHGWYHKRHGTTNHFRGKDRSQSSIRTRVTAIKAMS